MMMRKFVFAFVMSTIGAVSATFIATAAQTADDVFMDEGDGDFATSEMPPPPMPESPGPDTQAGGPPPEVDEYADLANPEEQTESEAPKAVAEKPKKQKHVAEKPARAKAQKVAKAPGKGRFLTTKQPCAMHRQPASESDTMTNVKAPRKIWIEEVDSDWVRAFNSAGQPGYVSRECFQ